MQVTRQGRRRTSASDAEARQADLERLGERHGHRQLSDLVGRAGTVCVAVESRTTRFSILPWCCCTCRTAGPRTRKWRLRMCRKAGAWPWNLTPPERPPGQQPAGYVAPELRRAGGRAGGDRPLRRISHSRPADRPIRIVDSRRCRRPHAAYGFAQAHRRLRSLADGRRAVSRISCSCFTSGTISAAAEWST